MRAVGLHSAVAILIAGTGVGLAVGSANADTAAPVELEASDSADSGVRDATPTAQRAEQRRKRREVRPRRAERRLERRELRSQRREERLVHARAVLFEGIELSAEQSRGVDAIIEAELRFMERFEELNAEFATAKQQDDTERLRAISAEGRSFPARRRGPDECMEEMRALLSEEQRSIFDMNRARLAAEDQRLRAQKQRRQGRRPRVDAELKAE